MLLTEHTGKLPDGWKRIPLPPKTQLDEGNKRKGDYSKTEACQHYFDFVFHMMILQGKQAIKMKQNLKEGLHKGQEYIKLPICIHDNT